MGRELAASPVPRVASYLAPGLLAGEPAIVIAEDARRGAIAARLEAHGLDVSAAIASGDLIALDAQATLALFLSGDELSWDRFERVIGRVIDELQARRPGKRVRAYDEMVDVLWRSGKRTTTLELEELWNRLAQTRAFALLCAYRTDSEAREEAQRAVRFDDVFADQLAHDLRNPLGTIMMGASQLARTSPDARTARTAARILSGADRMALMIDQFHDFMRIRTGDGLRLRPANTELAEVCARVKIEAERDDPAARIALIVQADTAGCWDAERLRHAIATLIDNAIAHGASGSVVELELDGAAPASVVVTVRNRGAIAPEILPVLFEPVRGDQKRQRSHGLGLGLFLAKQTIEAHGGAIDVTSAEDAGTTFRIVLPRVAAHEAVPVEAAG